MTAVFSVKEDLFANILLIFVVLSEKEIILRLIEIFKRFTVIFDR
jgi:hypothetical protein